MTRIFIILFTLTTSLTLGQTQWFPQKYDTVSKKMIPDTTHAYPISFIKVHNGLVSMYGYHTHYKSDMKLSGAFYFSNWLTIRSNEGAKIYNNAKYYFYMGKVKSKLIIKMTDRTDTIIFLKSTRPFKDINAPWG